MGYSYDAEKEKLANFANSAKNIYNGPTEEIKIIEILFDENTRKCQIIYNLKKGKRTIDKRFTYMGEQYKIYSDWQYTTTEKNKKITLTDRAIENLPQMASEDKIINLALASICKALPIHLQPIWFKKDEIKKKYQIMRDAQKRQIFDEYNPRISPLTMMINSKKKKKEELYFKLTKSKETYSFYTSQIDINTTILDKHNESNLRWFYHLFDGGKRNIVQRAEDRLSEIVPTMEEEERVYLELEQEVNDLNEKLNIIIEERDEKLKEKYDAVKLLENEEIEALNNMKPVQVSSSPMKRGVPSEEWIKEERNKMGRVYKDNLTLRDYILKRDNYTCQKCGNSSSKEPNLLLEVDHIQPVSKWGPSIPENLETLCWKCNRSKSNKS